MKKSRKQPNIQEVVILKLDEISFAMCMSVLKLKIGYWETEANCFQACKKHNMGQLIKMMKVKPCISPQSERLDNEQV